MSLRRYTGYFCSVVGKDAAYSVVSHGDGWRVRLTYELDHRQKLLLTTSRHGDLVEMVNEAKTQMPGGSSRGGGRFYLNEFKDVLVPDGSGGAYWAGKYYELLEFEYDGSIISAEAQSGLKPGDLWKGPHVGIRYILAAGGDDIRYEQSTDMGDYKIVREERLSEVAGGEPARDLARRLSRVKGNQGGRIYINERGHFFSNQEEGGLYVFRYLGSLKEDDPWFLPPDDFED